MRGLLTLGDISTEKIREIINLALEFKNGKKVCYDDVKIATLFFENSTRTQYSFQMAMLNLGITPVVFSSIGSSIAKGETLYDTVKTFEALGVDGAVIRHSEDKYYRRLEGINIPIFNGGDGKCDHPTQTLLDLVTIYEEFGRFDGLTATFIGDVAHSRVAHGNNDAFKRLGMKTLLCGPDEFLDESAPAVSIEETLASSDVINLLRVQFERNAVMDMTKAEYHNAYGMTLSRVAQMKDNAIIIHPAPVNRGVELADDVVECEKSRIFEQMKNGVYARMAVISMSLEGSL